MCDTNNSLCRTARSANITCNTKKTRKPSYCKETAWCYNCSLQVFCWEQQPHPYSTQFWGWSPWTRLPVLGLRETKTLSSLSINYFRTNPTYMAMVTEHHDGQTDRQMHNLRWQYCAMHIVHRTVKYDICKKKDASICDWWLPWLQA